MRASSVQHTGETALNTPSESAEDFRAGPDNPPVETEETTTSSNLPLTAFTWGDDAFTPDWSYMSDLALDLGGGDPLDSQVHASSTGSEPQSALDNTTFSEQPFQLPFGVPVSLGYRDPSSLFERRRFSEPELELTGELALHILRSYPYMMASPGSVPPFIHSHYQCLSEGDTGRPSPLNAALTLAKTLLQGRRMNKSLIWGLIRIEQERLLNEHSSFGKWEVLEALQSLVVYILLRIIEGRHDHTNFDTQLLASLNAVCGHITTTFGKLISFDEMAGRMMTWKDWVFSESRRRTATAFIIIDGILHTQITNPPPTMPEYSSSPAPSPTQLWQAENEMDWAAGYAEYLHANAVHGMLKNGDLVKLKEEAGGQHDRWYAYADSFGLLVTLAANMIS
ncbi:Uu.00g126160.m01.CDS01 [Anthostomella pinea]|uniref:Uu.00g126160.m01.CDS01 n=1 Tax=Anthostomella pinea TaxID=933095 RepID=A0AAI8YHW7_9PEZI|nr:Uu.00g126160.m01.CDS01 [Anthostomella pinea]